MSATAANDAPMIDRRSRYARPVMVGCGLLLLTAAILKLTGGGPAALGQNAVLLSPSLRVLLIEAELVLGLWLMSGWARRPAWVAAVSVFVLFAAASGYLWTEGQSSCGCFGRVVVHPAATLVVDAVAVAALLSFRPRGSATGSMTYPVAVRSIAVLGVPLVLVLTAGYADRATGAGAFAWLRGESVVMEPSEVDIGTGEVGEVREFTMVLRNVGGHPIRLIGHTASFACQTTALPADVPAHGELPVVVRAVIRGTPGPFRQDYTLFTDDASQPTLTVRVIGRVR